MLVPVNFAKRIIQSPRPPPWIFVVGCVLTLCLVFTLFPGRPAIPRVVSLRGGSRSRNFLQDVYNNTLGFEKIFVISLPERSDRRDGMVLASALSEMEFAFIDAQHGDDIADKAVPGKGRFGNQGMNGGALGCWRGHMDALQTIVRRNISTALLLEDDADWDVRIKEQFHDLALSTNALIQPIAGFPTRYADQTYPKPPDTTTVPPDIDFSNLPLTVPPTMSPYGDDWDVIWTGHCGQLFPSPQRKPADVIPRGRVIHLNDPTVVPHKHLTNWHPSDLKAQYPPHTRAVHHVQSTVCSLSYAVSQAGARRILDSLGLHEPNQELDLKLNQFCEGSEGKTYHNCLTMQPPLFGIYRPVGLMSSESDITGHGTEYREKADSENIRWSVRMNFEALGEGRGEMIDQFPDEEEEEGK